MLDSFNFAIEYGTFHRDQKTSLISLLLKKGKDSLDCSSYSPVSLIPCDLKVYAKTLASRMEKVIQGLIKEDQTGFIKGCHAANNMRRLFYVLDFADSLPSPCAFFSLDAEKAFDRLEWNYIWAANGLEIPYIVYAVLDFKVAGVQIPARGVVIVKDEFSTNSLIGMNIISQCWSTLFQNAGQSSLLQFQNNQERQAWQQIMAVCQRVAACIQQDGSLGNVWLANRRGVRIPPRSEVLVWGRARMGPQQRDYCGRVEPASDQPVAAARTIAMVRDGKIPVRLCNIHPYSVFIGRYQKLGQLYEVNSPDIYGCKDLGLVMKTDGIVEVSLIEASPCAKDSSGPGIRQFSQRSDLTMLQCQDLDALLKKWSNVFAENEDDVGYTEVVQHRIHTGDVPPIRERF